MYAVTEHLLSLPLQRSQLPIYDREIELALLHRDERTGAEHYLIRYPEGLQSRPHTHTAAHTMVVLDGALEANGSVVEPPAYVHFPAGEPMTHRPASGTSCTFVIVFDGPFDAHPVDVDVDAQEDT